ncbi:hypothetical protein PHYPSEUDO_010880 [Phytophthora pseudosyringae]|uniref:Uncharacterized protein n=1 Tax=Phytophthora pseudosyringae TaxID=221518 RepID=A0A8T1VA94_9STRA|nr:hypothetical protein PHYPSEUDO_010880 [Phytophthora pseudosyringae]
MSTNLQQGLWPSEVTAARQEAEMDVKVDLEADYSSDGDYDMEDDYDSDDFNTSSYVSDAKIARFCKKCEGRGQQYRLAKGHRALMDSKLVLAVTDLGKYAQFVKEVDEETAMCRMGDIGSDGTTKYFEGLGLKGLDHINVHVRFPGANLREAFWIDGTMQGSSASNSVPKVFLRYKSWSWKMAFLQRIMTDPSCLLTQQIPQAPGVAPADQHLRYPGAVPADQQP